MSAVLASRTSMISRSAMFWNFTVWKEPDNMEFNKYNPVFGYCILEFGY
jgi:hypothetical protein